MKRRQLTGAMAAAWAVQAMPAWAGAPAEAAVTPAGEKVLRYAFSVAETGFDPAQISDLYSRIVTAHIFDAPLTYDHLARPFKLKPLVCTAMPEVSDDFRTFVFHIRPGIYFADDPAFKGQRRELVAEDFVYGAKRHFDPKLKSPQQSTLESEGIIGLRELHDDTVKSRKPFDYDRKVAGLRAVDRYTLRVQLRESRPRHLYTWAARDVVNAVAREVVEAYGDNIVAHPVGTGPFRLADWRRSSRIVLTRNPTYRDDVYDAEPNADDAAGQALVERFKGRKLPMIDRVEIAIIEQPQPRWLSFLGGEQDLVERLPNEFVDQAAPGGRIAPVYARRGLVMERTLSSDTYYTVFNMENEVVGGYTPVKVALRRAMVLGSDIGREIRIARHGQALQAQTLLPPMSEGYRDDMRTPMSEYDVPRAKALLDLYGYADRDGDGWRELPDGRPLVLEMATQSDQSTRELDTLWKKDMDALGLRAVLKTAQWPENLKATRAGKFMLWRVGSLASSPDGQNALERVYGPAVGKGNLARFRLAALDAVYDKLKLEPSGPSRQKLFDETAAIVAAYVPYRMLVHRIVTDFSYPWLIGYRRAPFWIDWWQFVDIDLDTERKRRA